MDMGVRVVVPGTMRMSMVMGMTVGMAVVVAVGRGGNHPRTLYYNITPVHAAKRAVNPVPASKKGGRAWRPPPILLIRVFAFGAPE